MGTQKLRWDYSANLAAEYGNSTGGGGIWVYVSETVVRNGDGRAGAVAGKALVELEDGGYEEQRNRECGVLIISKHPAIQEAGSNIWLTS